MSSHQLLQVTGSGVVLVPADDGPCECRCSQRHFFTIDDLVEYAAARCGEDHANGYRRSEDEHNELHRIAASTVAAAIKLPAITDMSGSSDELCARAVERQRADVERFRTESRRAS